MAATRDRRAIARRKRATRRALADVDLRPIVADLDLEAQLQTEIAMRRAERIAVKRRRYERRAARRRFLIATLVLLALVSVVGYLIFDASQHLFGR